MDDLVFDPATTEQVVMFRPQDFCIDAVPGDQFPCNGCEVWCAGDADPSYIDTMYDFKQRGWIPYARSSDLLIELVRRIYDLSPETIPCPEDLDGNGVVDADDANRLASNIGTPDATLYHGDLDFDDDVDVIDYFLLVAHPGFPDGICDP